MGRERQLQEDAMHGGIPVLLLQMLGQILFGDIGGETMGPGLDAHLGGVGVLGRDIHFGRGVVADQGDAQAGADAELGELADALLEGGADVFSGFFSVEQYGHGREK